MRRTLALLALAVAVGGCGLLPGHAESAVKTKSAPLRAKPKDAKSFYLRMVEIDHGAEIQVAAELRHFRRAVANGPLAAKNRAFAATIRNGGELDDTTEKEFKALGTPPKEMQSFFALRIRALDASRNERRRAETLIKRGDFPGVMAEIDRQSPARHARNARLHAADVAIRHRFRLGAKPKSAFDRMAPPSGSKSAAKHRPIQSLNDLRIDPKDRAHVRYAAGLQSLMVRSRKQMATYTAGMREGLPRDPAAQDLYMRRCVTGALRIDRATLATLRRMGPAPKGLARYTRLLDLQVTTSIAGSERILAGSYDARETIELLNAEKPANGAIAAQIRAESRVFMEGLRRIKAKYEG